MSANRSRSLAGLGNHDRKSSSRTGNRRRNLRRTLGAALEPLESRMLLAFSADVFSDINKLGISSNVDSMVQFDGRAFFAADDGQSGSELWVSDGTAGGTQILVDLLPGSDGSLPSNLTVVGTTLFFTASDDGIDNDLWKTDGTVAGTVKVFDANEAGVYNLRDLTASGGKLFFSAYQADTDPGPGNNATGQELWVSNGTSAGTLLLLDINPDQTSYDGPQELTDHNGTLFFTSYDEFLNRDLWKSDGTPGTTIKVADLNDLNTSELTSVGTNLFFAAEDVATGLELYVYNGTTTSLLEINPGIGSSSPRDITEFNGQAYFSAANASGTRFLYRSNGTTFNAVNGGTLVTNPAELTVVGTTLFYAATVATSGRELWKTSTTNINTLVEDIIAGVGSSNPTNLTEAGGRLYFSADQPTTFGRELWRSQGLFDAASTGRLIDSYTGTGSDGSPNDGNPQDLVEINNRLFFTTVNNAGDRELWTSQGTAATTTLLKDINPSTQSANPEQLVVFGTKIFFVANDGLNGDAVWVADTTVAPGPSNPVMIDMTPGTRAESISGLSIQDGSVWFYNNLAGANAQGAIYRTDGTTTTLVGQQTPIVQSSTDPNDLFTTYLGRVYFVAEDNTGVELWRSDGPGNTIARFVNLFPGTNNNDGQNSSNPGDLTVFNGKLYFAATVNVPVAGTFDGFGRELYETDGTALNTVMTADIYVDDVAGNGVIRSSNPDQLIVSGTNLFFVADSGVFVTGNGLSGGRELFVLPAGGAVTLVENVVGDGGIDPGAGGSTPVNLTNIGGTLYFSANNNSDVDMEPYRTDGVTTTLIQNVNTTTNIGSFPSGFTAFGGQVYFSATGTSSGRELWRTTVSGAEQVFDVSGTSSANPSEIAATSTRLFYSAVDENQSDRELWTAGGPLTTGAAQTLDLFPGVFRGGDPKEIVEVGGKVYFVGQDENSGRELFVLTQNIVPQVESVVINDGSAQRSQITSVTVKFDNVVSANAAAFQLTNIGNNTPVTNVQVSLSEVDFKTVAVLTFGTGGANVANRAGVGTLGNSLANGNYRLTVLAAQVADPTGGAGLAANHVFGGQTASGVPNDDFFRHYGDANGDGFTDFTDFSNDFLPGFGTANGNAQFRDFLDGNGDGFQDFTDFSNFFLPGFGTSRL